VYQGVTFLAQFVAALAHRRAKENRESDRDVIVDEW